MSRPPVSDDALALLRLGDTVSLTHFRLNAVLEALHSGGPGTASRRAILRNVIENGPMTVPQIAALRPVSRQYVQSVVDALKAEGLVELADNPTHRRSKLVRATPAGESVMAHMASRELPLLSEAAEALGASAEELRAAADLLARLNKHMDTLTERLREGGDL